MDIVAKIRNFIIRLQNLSDRQKKIVLWTIVAVLGIIMAYFWVMGAANNLSKIGNSMSQVKLPEIQTPEIPSVATPTDQTADWQTYTNAEYGFEIKYPSDWNAGVSTLMTNIVLFCPPELASSDPDVICKLDSKVNHVDTQAPIVFSLVQKKLQLSGNNEQYGTVFDLMNNSLKFTK